MKNRKKKHLTSIQSGNMPDSIFIIKHISLEHPLFKMVHNHSITNIQESTYRRNYVF